MIEGLTPDEAKELETFWAEFNSEHIEEIDNFPPGEFEKWQNLINDFLIKFFRMSEEEKQDYMNMLDDFCGIFSDSKQDQEESNMPKYPQPKKKNRKELLRLVDKFIQVTIDVR